MHKQGKAMPAEEVAKKEAVETEAAAWAACTAMVRAAAV